jgi:hypothetical protein
LVDLVLKKSYSIATSARRLGIKLSTAKLIVKKYREEGCFFEKREDRKARLELLRAKGEERERCQVVGEMAAVIETSKEPAYPNLQASSFVPTLQWPVYYPYCPYYPSESVIYFYL